MYQMYYQSDTRINTISNSDIPDKDKVSQMANIRRRTNADINKFFNEARTSLYPKVAPEVH